MLVNSVLAYIGPGAGLGLMGALIGLMLAVLGALSFVVLWPLRMLFRKREATDASALATDGSATPDDGGRP